MNSFVPDNSKFFQYSLNLLCIANNEGKFIRLNSMWYKMLGYKISELEGMSYLELIHPDDIQRVQESINELHHDKEVIDFTIRFRHKDGTYHWIEWRVFPDGDNLYLSGNDITRLKRAEEELYNVNEVHQTVVDTVTAGLVFSKEGKFEWVNNAFLKMFNCSLDDIKGQPINLFYKNKEDIARIEEEASRCFEKGNIYVQEIEVTNKDNSINWVHITGKVLIKGQIEGDSVWMIQDISEQKAITANLKESEEQIQGIAQNIPGILFQFYYDETHKMGLNYVSGNTKKYLHLDDEDIDTLFDRFIARIPKEEQPVFLSSIQKAIETKSNWHWIGNFILSDGTKRILEGASRPRQLKNQLVFDGIILDTTTAKESEMAVEKGVAILKSMLESINSAILIVGDNGEILHYNQSFVYLFNIPRDLLITKNDKLLIDYAKNQLIIPDEFVKKIGYIYKKNIYTQDLIYFKNGHIINRQFFPLIKESPVKGGVWIFTDITSEKKNKETLELFKTSTDNSVEEIYWLNKEGNFEYINEMACKKLGYSKEEFLNLTIFNIDPTLSKLRWDEIWKSFQERNSINKPEVIFETTNQRKDGSVYPVEVSVFHLKIEDKEFHISHVRDISDRKREEEILRRSEEKYRLLFENMTSAFALHEIIYDKEGKPLDYRYIEANPAFKKLTGVEVKQLIGKTVKEILPETEDYWIQTFGNVAKTGNPISYINFAKELNKYYETYAFCPGKDHFAVVFNDITERIENEDSLKLFKSTTDYSSEAVYWFSPDAKFIYANEGACKMLGYSKKELLSMRVFDIDPVYPEKEWQKHWEDYRNNRTEKSLKIETIHKRKDGSLVHVDVITSFLTINNKEFQIAHGRDVTDRVRNEEILQKFKASIDYSLDGIYWINEESGFDYVNEKACKMLGYSYEELMHLKIADIDPVATNDNFKTIWDNLHQNKKFEAFTVESKHKRKDGSVFPVELNSVFVWKDNKGLLISYAKDISERKQYEGKLLENQKLLNDSQKAGNIGSWEYYVQTDELIWNDQVYDIYGIDKSVKPNYKVFIDIVHPDDRTFIEQKYRKSIEQGIFTDYDYRIIRPDNTLRYLKTSGNIEYTEKNIPYRTYGIVQDITQQKEYEEELLKNQKLLTESQRIARMGSWEIDIPNRNLYWNDGAINILGFKNKEIQITLEVFWSMILPEDVHIAKNHFDETLHTKEFKDFECRFKLFNNTVLTIRIVGELILDDKGNPVRMLGIVQDITEHKKAEEELLKSQKLLLDSQRAAKIGSWEYVINKDELIWNDLTYNIYGIGDKSIKPNFKISFDLTHPDDRKFVEEKYLKAINTGVFDEFEYRLLNPDKTVKHVRIIGKVEYKFNKPHRTFGILQDITEHKKAEEDLIRSQKLLSESQRVAQIGCWENDLLENKMTWNEEAYKIFGYGYKEIELNMQNYKNMIYPDDIPYVLSAHKSVIENKKFQDYEYRIIRKDGEIRNIFVVGDVELNELDEVYRMFGILQDITERKKVEDSLRLTQFSIDTSSDSFMWFDENAKVVYANEAACNSLGYTEEELMNMKSFEFDPDFKIERWEQHKKQLQAQKRMVFESRHKRKDGSIFPVEITTNYINYQGKFFACTFDKDITERKQYEETLLKNQKLLNESQRIAQMGSWELNLIDNSLYWSESMYKLYGIDKDKTAISQDLFLDLVHPEDKEHVLYGIENTIKTGFVSNDEFRILKSNGEVRSMVTSAEVLKDEKNQPVIIIGVVQDITESKIAKEALIESEERARLFVENTPLPIALFDTNMHYIIASKQWNITYKVSNQDIIGRDHYEIFPETPDRWKNLHQRAIKGEVIKNDKDKFIRLDGSIQWVRYELHPWYKGDKTIGGMVAFTEDITERVLASEALKESELKMQRIFELAPIGLGITKNRKTLDLNSQLPIISGYSYQELKGADSRILYPDNKEYDRVGEILYSRMKEKGIGEIECVWKRKDGKRIDVYLAITLIDRNDPSKGSIFITMDITERKNYEQALEKRVLALTRPLDDISSIEITDLFNIDDLQEIQDTFAKATGVASLITTPDGTPITRPGNFCNFCNRIRSTEIGEKKCNESDAQIGKNTTEGLNIQTCMSAGLWNAGAAINVGGVHVANWLIGQIRNEQLNEHEIFSYAEKLGINKDEYIKAYYEVPTMTLEQFEHVAKALNSLANELAMKAYQNIQQARFITEQKKVSEELMKNQKLLLESQRIAKMGSWELDLKTNKLFWNKEAYMVYGYDYLSIEPTLEVFFQLIHPEDRLLMEKHLETIIETRKIGDVECRIITPGGKLKYIIIVGEITFDKKNEPYRVFGIIQDITQQKNYESQIIREKERAEENEQKFRRIFEFAPISIGLLDKRIILDVNSQAVNLTWYNREELIGKNTEIVYPSREEFERVGNIMYQQLEEDGFSEFESTWKRKDGKLINVYLALTYLDPEDPSKGVLFSGMDTTKQKEVEEHLRKAKERAEESEYFLQESQRTGNIGSFKFNIKTQNWISTKTLNKIFGITDSYKRDLNGWINIIHPDDRENIKEYLENEVITQKQPFNFEYKIIRKNDKKIRWVHSIGKLYIDKDGNPGELLGTIQDITDRKLIEEERRLMNIELENRVKDRTAQLHQVNKDLESFAYSVSHDLRAPIRHIHGFVHLLQKVINPMDTKAQNYIDKIISSSKNMSTMIDELLQFSRLGRTEIQFSEVDLQQIINDIINQFKPDYANRNIQWKVQQISKVKGEQALLRIVMENLISNAIKYTSKKELTIIEIGEIENDDSETVCIYIKDNGAGFDMAYKDKLFGVFQRLHQKEEFEGTGIGLANVKQIIIKHKGTIDANSEINKGATFYITLLKQ